MAVQLNRSAYYSAPDSADFTFSSCTIEAWVKAINFVGIERLLSSQDVAYWGLDLNRTGSGRIGFLSSLDNPSSGGENGGASIEGTGWLHVAVKRIAGDKWYVYRNGVLVASAAVSATGGEYDIPDAAYIGSFDGTGEIYGGFLDEVRFWGIARSDAEIKADAFRRIHPGSYGLRWLVRTGGQSIVGGSYQDLSGHNHPATRGGSGETFGGEPFLNLRVRRKIRE